MKGEERMVVDNMKWAFLMLRAFESLAHIKYWAITQCSQREIWLAQPAMKPGDVPMHAKPNGNCVITDLLHGH